MKHLLWGSVLGLALLFSGAAQAQMSNPREQVGKRHPNLAAAQHHVDQALSKIEEAQQANEMDLGGHAKHAKELLDEANKELKEAAQFANKNEKKAKPQ